MNSEQTHSRAKATKELSVMGAELIASLRAYVTAGFTDHILDTSTPHRLYVSFYGLTLLFRVEIAWGGDAPLANISAYSLSDVPPKEVPLDVHLEFDSLGNILDPKITKKEFPPVFLQKIFAALHANKVILKP